MILEIALGIILAKLLLIAFGAVLVGFIKLCAWIDAHKKGVTICMVALVLSTLLAASH